MGIGDWGLGIGDWGLGPIPNPHVNIYLNSKNYLNIFHQFKTEENIFSKK